MIRRRPVRHRLADRCRRPRVGHHQRIGPRLADRHHGRARARRRGRRRRRARRRARHARDRRPRPAQPRRPHPRRLPHRRQRLRAGRRRRCDGAARAARGSAFPSVPTRARRAGRPGRGDLRSRPRRPLRQPPDAEFGARAAAPRAHRAAVAARRGRRRHRSRAGGLQGGVGMASTRVDARRRACHGRCAGGGQRLGLGRSIRHGLPWWPTGRAARPSTADRRRWAAAVGRRATAPAAQHHDRRRRHRRRPRHGQRPGGSPSRPTTGLAARSGRHTCSSTATRSSGSPPAARAAVESEPASCATASRGTAALNRCSPPPPTCSPQPAPTRC